MCHYTRLTINKRVTRKIIITSIILAKKKFNWCPNPGTSMYKATMTLCTFYVLREF